MLSNNTLSAIVDTLDRLSSAHKAEDVEMKYFYLDLADLAIGRVVRGMPQDHPQREAVLKKQRQLIFARARLVS